MVIRPSTLCRIIGSWVLLIALVCQSSPAHAFGLFLRAGPPGLGNGGPNPISFSALDFEIGHVTAGGIETSLSVTGVLVGVRHTSSWGGYVTLGGGFVLSAAGAGPGVFTEIGADLRCGWWCWNAALVQAAGYSSSEGRLTFPYAARLGISTWFK